MKILLVQIKDFENSLENEIKFFLKGKTLKINNPPFYSILTQSSEMKLDTFSIKSGKPGPVIDFPDSSFL